MTVTGTTGSVALSWGAVCHAADYIIYRAPVHRDDGRRLVADRRRRRQHHDRLHQPDRQLDDQHRPAAARSRRRSPTPGSPGSPAPAGEPPDRRAPRSRAATSRTRTSTPRSPAPPDGGIKYFGADASKPYPNPADGAFATGALRRGRTARRSDVPGRRRAPRSRGTRRTSTTTSRPTPRRSTSTRRCTTCRPACRSPA